MISDTEKDVLNEEFDVVLCTCNESCSKRLLHLAKNSRISHCIIDECGMATEPETITTISLCDHVVLIGDHEQLQPIISHRPASENGLSTSMFERYANNRKNLLVRLTIQYRMVSDYNFNVQFILG